MIRHSQWALLLPLLCASPLSGQTTSFYTRVTDTIVRLPQGDSVELQASGPAVVPNEPTGLLITYRPFVSLSDTVVVNRVALALFRELLPHFTGSPPFVVMRAVDVAAARRNQGGYYPMSSFGVVLERHPDGRWYRLHAHTPAF